MKKFEQFFNFNNSKEERPIGGINLSRLASKKEKKA
jgi:hypothetical protein